MEQIAEFNFIPPLPPVEMVNILNDQVNYVEDNIINTGTDYVAIDVVNTQTEPAVLPEEPAVLLEEPAVLHNFTQGEFLYVDNIRERMMLQNGWAAVEQLELWDFMKKDCEGYAWSDAPEVLRIGQKMAELGYDGHTGSSFAYTMRHLQYIATHGEDAYRNLRMQSE